MTRRLFRHSAFAFSTLLVAGTAAAQQTATGTFPESSAASSSQPTREQCLDAHKSAQELKHAGKFMEAQAHLVVCSSASCPGVVISDCGTWIADLEKMTPSMIFEIRVDGKEAVDAKLFVDAKPITDISYAVKVNPGRHTVRVELPPFKPYEETLTLPEGQRMRLVAVDFRSQKPALNTASSESASASETKPERPTPVIVYPLLGVGIAGLASFGVFSYLGRSKQTDLEETCAPECTDGDLESMKTMYLIGDISAGVGAAALLTSAIVYFTRPAKTTENPSSFSVGVGSLASQGASFDSFGVTAAGKF